MANTNVNLDLTRDQAITLLESIPDSEVYNPLAEALDKATDNTDEQTIVITISIAAGDEDDDESED